MAQPTGYRRLAPGVRCRCIHTRADENGDYWCCDGKPAGLERSDAAGAMPAEPSHFDIDLEILATLLHLHEHGIRIVRVDPSRSKPRRAITLVIAGDDLPPGECIAGYRQVGEMTVLQNIRGAEGKRRRP